MLAKARLDHLISAYCFDCHDSDVQKGGLNTEALLDSDLADYSDEAEAALEAAIALDPMSTESRRWLGILSLKVARNLAVLGRPDEAIRKLRPAFIDQPRVYADIAGFYLDLNAPQMAEQVLASAEDSKTVINTRNQIISA